MGRRREESVPEVVFAILKIAPWWVGPVLMAVSFVFLRFVVPAIYGPEPGNALDSGIIIRTMAAMLSWFIPLLLFGIWIAAEAYKPLNRQRLDVQTGPDSIARLSWGAFEELICEAYRRHGYVAETVGSSSGDGGVDVRLTTCDETVLVQCKQWRARRVGVKPVRELLGVVTSEGAARGILVTSGSFTQDALDFTEENPEIELIDGPALVRLIKDVQTRPRPASTDLPARDTTPLCPSCGVRMVIRTAKKGPNAGSQFWGCSRYPRCRETKPLAVEASATH